MNKRLSLGFLIFVLVFSQCSISRFANDKMTGEQYSATPDVNREFRAAWIATVANINWPSKPGLSVDEQKKEAVHLLDFLKENNFNAIIFQVRPQCDALYDSSLEPWSYYLTGKQGQAPDPYYDPLEFWIEETHKRAMEFHAWFNPYRAHHTSGGEMSDNSIVKTHPELITELDNGFYWMIPTEQGTQDYSFNVVMDVVKRYNIDGIHFDDYFYPYPSYHGGKDFPDDNSWNKYLDKGGRLSRADWRRDAVNRFMKRVYKGIKTEKPHVKFGLSPFGVWRPNHPASIKGLDQYDVLYADAKLWLNKGWIDYWTPQLYWPINQMPQSFPVLVNWWDEQNVKDRHFWPGISPKAKQGSSEADEAFNQIMIARGMLSESPGIVYWNMNAMLKSEELTTTLKSGPFRQAALVPASPWLGKKVPEVPVCQIEEHDTRIKVSWEDSHKQQMASYVIGFQYGDKWDYEIVGRYERSYMFDPYRCKDLTPEELSESSDMQDLVEMLNVITIQSVNVFGHVSKPFSFNAESMSKCLLPSLDELKLLIGEENKKVAALEQANCERPTNEDVLEVLPE
ncbi:MULTISPECIES: glycoside hydrolase family 10 protein [unclassified Carboxylicivirga]|uniref:glycoside hydrolase family 10 protein n=1 Tax=Carboxylicivirga TaxID=1628153 RepID=UPI003D333813